MKADRIGNRPCVGRFVSERALVQRINRKLAHIYERVCKTRASTRAREFRFGDYHRVDVYRNALVEYDVSLGDLGRELGCLANWETFQS